MTTVTRGWNSRFNAALFAGRPSSPLVPWPYPIGIAGRGYMLDTALLANGTFNHASIPYLEKFLTSPVFGSPAGQGELGENSLNPDTSWRRSTSTWHKGTGQTHFDLGGSDHARFRSSKGVDVWTQGQISLLPDVTLGKASSGTGLQLLLAGSYVYLADGTSLTHSTDGLTWADAGATTAIASVCSDGSSVYVALPAGVASQAAGGTALTHVNDLVPDLLGYVKGRLMCAKGPSLYNITDLTVATAPTALFTHPNSSWKWVGFATGDQNIYAAGYAGHYSAVYRIPIKTDGTGLATPIQAAELPAGETCSSILGYLGQVFLGTSIGLRTCSQASDGGLTVGSALPVGNVQCLTGYDRFCWFGWTDYDLDSTGLGRADVTVFNDDAPAYTTDLMAPVQGNVTSVISLGDKRIFSVAGHGVYVQSASLVASGSLDSGLITYDMPDPKIAISLDVKHSTPLVGSHSASLSGDGEDFVLLGNHTPSTQEAPFDARNTKAETFEVRTGIGRDTTDATKGPVLSRWTLMAVPAAASAEYITVPILLPPVEQWPTGQSVGRGDLAEELNFLKSLRLQPRVFTYQEGSTSHRVTMADYQWTPAKLAPGSTTFSGTFLAKLLRQADA